MKAEAAVEKAQGIYVQIEEKERELDMHNDRAKACKKTIEAYQFEVRELIKQVGPIVHRLPVDAIEFGIFACHEGALHEWQEVQDEERPGIVVMTCPKCGTTKHLEGEGDERQWVFSFKTEPEEALANATTDVLDAAAEAERG